MDLRRIAAAVPVLLICLLPNKALRGQEAQGNKTWATFKGTSTLTGYWSNRQGFGQDIPAQYLTWQFRGQLSLLGIPFSGSGLFSTMQHPGYQAMNYVSVKLDTRTLLHSKIQVPGLKFLKHFETLEVGRTRPDYSKLMLQGVMLQGCNVAVRFGGFYTAVAYGISQQPVSAGALWSPQYRQRMLFGRMGVGKPEKSKLYLSFLKYRDLPDSYSGDIHLFVQQPDTFVHLADTFFIPGDTIPLIRHPGEGLVVGVGGEMVLLKNFLKLQFELNGCANTTNITGEPLDFEGAPDWVFGIYQPRITTSVSYAARISGHLNLRNTRITAAVMRVAPGYRSAGVPYMRQDYEGIEIQASRMLLKRKLTLQPWCRVYHDNLSGVKPMTSNTGIYGISAFWRPVKLPWVSITWSPHAQKVTGELVSQKSNADVVTVASGKNYVLWKKINAFTGITWSGQWMQTNTSGVRVSYQGTNYMLQQTFMLKIPFSIQLAAGIYTLSADSISQISRQISAGCTYYHLKKWNAGAGIRHTGTGSAQRRTGLSANISANLGKAGRLSLIAEPIRYRDLLKPELEYNQYVVRGMWVMSI